MNIRQVRINMKLTQKELADKCQLSTSYIQKLECGKRKCPSIDIAFKIAKALDTTVQELFYED